MTGTTVRAFVVGLGPIGLEVCRALAGRADLALVGAADHAAELRGQDLGTLLGGDPRGQLVAPSAGALYAGGGADVAILCTGSRLADVAPQIEEALAAGLHVVSTCEELAHAGHRHPGLARALDARARELGLVVLGTGVNPGLVMDRLVLTIASGCVRVTDVRVERVVDAARRRGPIRDKVGAGLTIAEFEEGVRAGHLGHVGLGESAALVARGLGWDAEVEETIEPVVAARAHEGIPEGNVLGVRQAARVVAGGRPVVDLRLEMYVGAPSPGDRIAIGGDPPLEVVVPGGFQGDRATVGAVVHALPVVVRAPAGLRTTPELGVTPLAPAAAQ